MEPKLVLLVSVHCRDVLGRIHLPAVCVTPLSADLACRAVRYNPVTANLPSPPQPSLRVALFPDTFYEANGVATVSRHLAHFARDRDLPFLVVRGGQQTTFTRDGSLELLQLKRGPASFPLDKGLYLDPLLSRHRALVLRHLAAFKPDLLHITGPGDLGFLGLWVAHTLRIPLVASWHTNVHQYLARRLDHAFRHLPLTMRKPTSAQAERHTLRGLLRFYRTARFTLAPNSILVNLLRTSTQRPSYLMPHGVDLTAYSPDPNGQHPHHPFCIGYVGRLTAEKRVQAFIDIERQLLAAGERDFQFLIVGEGGQQKWLRACLPQAEIPGVLHGAALAAAYRRMDAFVFPSETDTFGLVILEAMASGVPVIVRPQTGRVVGIQDGVFGCVSEDFSTCLRRLMNDCSLRQSMSCAARNFAGSNGWIPAFETLYRIYRDGLAIPDLRRDRKEGRA